MKENEIVIFETKDKEVKLNLKVGTDTVYACSPEDSSFTAVFSNIQLVGCSWKAHDGQQPD